MNFFRASSEPPEEAAAVAASGGGEDFANELSKRERKAALASAAVVDEDERGEDGVEIAAVPSSSSSSPSPHEDVDSGGEDVAEEEEGTIPDDEDGDVRPPPPPPSSGARVSFAPETATTTTTTIATTTTTKTGTAAFPKRRKIRYRDHYSLLNPSSSVMRESNADGEEDDDGSTSTSTSTRTTTTTIRLYENWNSQLQLEERHLSEGDDGRGGSGGGGCFVDEEPGHGKDRKLWRNERYDTEITVKRMVDASPSLIMLRGAYALVCVFFWGFLLVFCLEILLFLALDFAVNSGQTTGISANVPLFIGTILSSPAYVYGLATALTMAGHYVADTFRGHALLRTLLQCSVVWTDWIAFGLFLGIPLTTIVVTLFAGADEWWRIGAIVWFACMFVAYGLFAASVVYYEIGATLELARYVDVHRTGRIDDDVRTAELVRRAILVRQIHRYSGTKKVRYVADGESDELTRRPDKSLIPKGEESISEPYKERSKERVGCYAKLTLRPNLQNKLFVRHPPKRHYGTDEARDVLPYLTRFNWSLEKIFCRPWNSRSIAVVRGPSAMTRTQMKSSLACAVLGVTIFVSLFASMMVWLSLNAAFAVVIGLVAFLGCLPKVVNTVKIYQMYEDVNGYKKLKTDDDDDEHDADEERGVGKATDGSGGTESRPPDPSDATNGSDGAAPDSHGPSGGGVKLKKSATERLARRRLGRGIDVDDGETAPGGGQNDDEGADATAGLHRAWETYRISRATDGLCWTMFAIEISLFYVWPLVTLSLLNNPATASLFAGVGLFSVMRYYLSASILLKEVGTIEDIGDKPKGYRAERGKWKWKARARASTIIGNVSRGRSRNAWIAVFSIFTAVFLILMAVSIGTNTEDGDSAETMSYLPDFYYPPQPDLPYPTCRLRKGLDIPGRGIEGAALIDYTYLAVVAYLADGVTQGELDQWFGPRQATNNPEIVNEFRAKTDNAGSQVSYKLVTFESLPKFGLVTIRGTSTSVDMFADMQLWSAAALMQLVRSFLPFGGIWTPVLDDLIRGIYVLQSDSIERVSFYKQTTLFVRTLRNSANYTQVHVTGHSLGGGLAIVTGAQTGVPSVAISGPNAMLSRRSFSPPVTEDALNAFAFNVIPDRDVVPMIDDPAMLYQRIACGTDANDFFGCHASRRTLCELMYTCGTGPRPALCMCSEKYGYPEPISNGTRTFAEACRG